MAKITVGAVLKVIEYVAVAAYNIAKACKKDSDTQPPKPKE